MNNDIFNIAEQFQTEGQLASINPFGSGHINDSFLVVTHQGEASDYVLQRINHHIFSDVPALTANILHVTNHIRKKLSDGNHDHGGFNMMQLIPTHRGEYFFSGADGNFWRLFTHIRGSRSYDRITTPGLAFEGGRAFALFQCLTSDMEVNSLREILPGFHNISLRLEKFRNTVRQNPAGRVMDAGSEISFVEARAAEMHLILHLCDQGHIPLRVTHNDTKINNVLFDYDDNAISVVDLDTVMPGCVLYDFGDAIRTGAATAAEDEPDLTKVGIDLDLFEAYSKGYLGMARRFLNHVEISNLAFSAKLMTYIIGLRFLTDYLDGDHYFRIQFPRHNLQRARTQFRLLESMENNFGQMREIIRKFDETN